VAQECAPGEVRARFGARLLDEAAAATGAGATGDGASPGEGTAGLLRHERGRLVPSSCVTSWAAAT